MSKHKKLIKSKKPVQPETPTAQQDTNPEQTPMDVMREAGFNKKPEGDFEPTWEDIARFISMMRSK